MKNYIVRGISLPFEVSDGEAITKAEKLLKKYSDNAEGVSICRRSVDARNKNDIKFVYSVICKASGVNEDKLNPAEITPEKITEPDFTNGNTELSDRPCVVGFGPCGMFCALALAEAGYKPIICEQGPNTQDRARQVDIFNKTGVLNKNANIQFGAGGAGTFSDGKLITRINDGLCNYVLNRLHDFGAPDDILVNARPHIGTDKLCHIVDAIADRIISLGGDIRFDTLVEGFECSSDGTVTSIKTNKEDIKCGAVVLAIGHSARDTYEYLLKQNEILIPKPISVGFRVEHLRSDIDKALYGRYAGNPLLGSAEYNLSCHIGNFGVYTFCMCPGGQVVAAASEEGGVVTNGASDFARDGVNSNSAVAISVSPENPMDFQRDLERKAFELGGGNYGAPIQTLGDFLNNKSINEPTTVMPTYTRHNVKLSNLCDIIPENLCAPLQDGLKNFGKKIEGFDSPYAILTGLETRTSAPYRIERTGEFTTKKHGNLYPAGEGAGYAGGITSAAVDGLKCALAIVNKYKPF